MDSDVLEREGFSLIELSLALMIAAIFLAAGLYSGQKIKQAAKAQRVIEELDSITVASAGYYSQNGAWPVGVSDLRPGYLAPGSSDLNPFGNAYVIRGVNSTVSVSTLLPKGLITSKSTGCGVVIVNQGDNDLVSITRPTETSSWKLKYEKKYIYHQ